MITAFPFLLILKGFFGSLFGGLAVNWKWLVALVAITVLAFFGWDAWGDYQKRQADKKTEVISVLAAENKQQQEVIEFVQESHDIDTQAVVTAIEDREIITKTHDALEYKSELKIKDVKQTAKKKIAAEPDPVKKVEIAQQADREVAAEQITSLWESFCSATTDKSPGAVSTCMAAA